MNNTTHEGELGLFELRDRLDRMIKPGDKVKLCEPHRRAGEVGIYKGVERINATGAIGALVRFEEGVDGCYVFKADQWERVI